METVDKDGLAPGLITELPVVTSEISDREVMEAKEVGPNVGVVETTLDKTDQDGNSNQSSLDLDTDVDGNKDTRVTTVDTDHNLAGHEEVVVEQNINQKAKDREEYQKMLEDAHNSLDGRGIGEVGVSHRYWGLMNTARQFAMNKGLV